MKCLVTGCAGFIGSTLTDRLLNDGHSVIGLDCFTDYYSPEIKRENIKGAYHHPRFTLIESDILRMSEFPEVDVVFHLAAQAGVRASWGSDFLIYSRNNIEATQVLLEWYRKRKLKKFVYASSSSVYGDVPIPMREDVRIQPVSPYGVTKLAAEHLCYLYWKNFGLPVVSLRYFSVYGPRQRPDMAINKFVKAIFQNKPITVFGDGSQTRDFTYVSDVVDANIRAADSPVNGEVFNIGGGSRISVIGLIREIEAYSGKTAQIRFEEFQKGDVNDTLAENTKAQECLAWTPKVTISNGVKNYIEWFIKNAAVEGKT
ncbi:MAG TPA: NAD-dependent epimerase/dehydratase family protein [Bacteroidales bacterium]|nr:NAD-dependent epimerase/dehydratase family protein [Bacteroidales bacterium]